MFYTYILKSLKTNRFYIGCTNDIEARLKRHNSGLVHSTKFYRPWELVYNEKYSTLSQARSREQQIKAWKKRAAIEKLINAPFV